ncbi:MAG: sodium-dependent transporter [Butyricicoccus sp.]|nr:sodium-dependent transporter [Butyricicoccus sp.]
MKTNSRAGFSSRWGFVLAAVGSAVGMANVWGFPAKMGMNGGGAFLLAYLFFIALFSTVGLAAEFAMGRRSRAGALGAYPNAWSSRKPSLGKIGEGIAWLPLVGCICISIGYAVIVAYVLKALYGSLNGELMQGSPDTWFSAFSENPYSVVIFHVIVVVLTMITLLLGAKGIEKSNKIMMPLFFLIFLVLAIRVAFLPGAMEGYRFMFTPDWRALADPMVWVWAMGQAFFSLSLIGSGMISYGSYLSDGESVIKLAVRTAIFDTIAALVASMVIIPACFAYELDLGAGPSLLFVTLPKILQDIPFGQFFAVILYVAMIFAGISSLQNMFEAVAESIQFRFPRLKRAAVLTVLCLVCLGIGINMEAISSWGPWMDIVSIYIIPLGATIGAISWFWIMRKEDLLGEVEKNTPGLPRNLWYYIGKFFYVPCALLLCMLALVMQIAF